MIHPFYLLIISFLCLIACEQNVKEKATPISNNKNKAIGDTLENSYAEAFRIIQFDDKSQLEILEPMSKKVIASYSYGAENNSFESDRIIALSATHISMMEKLGLLDQLIGIASADYLCSEEVIKRHKKKRIATVGDLSTADIEHIVSLEPSIVIFSGFNLSSPLLSKLEKSNVPTLINFDWKETHPLGRAEWIKVFGLIANKIELANEIFDGIKKRYETVAKTANLESLPTVFAGTLYGDVFNAPAGESYFAQLLKDAQVEYRYADTRGTASISLSIEEVIHDNETTDFWLNPAAKNKNDIIRMNPLFQRLRAFKNNQIYSYYKNVNCFWERSIVEPDVLLQEIKTFFHSTDTIKWNYYHRLNN